jgi:predicted site-specific integrase-resolvase
MPELLTRREAAEILRVKPNTLNTWNWRKRYGLPLVKCGGRCLYRREDIERFIAERLVRNEDDAK